MATLTPVEVHAKIHEISRQIHALEELFRVASIPGDLLAPLYRWRSDLSGELVSLIGQLPSGVSPVAVLEECDLL